MVKSELNRALCRKANAKEVGVTLNFEREPDSAQMTTHHAFQPNAFQLGGTTSGYISNVY